MRHSSVVLLIGLATLATFIETSVAETLCPHCVCLPSYSPVCGRLKDKGKLRGFSSRCVLECTNKCRVNKYEFYFNGRCGKAPRAEAPIAMTYSSSTMPPPTTTPSTTAATPPPTTTTHPTTTPSPTTSPWQTTTPAPETTPPLPPLPTTTTTTTTTPSQTTTLPPETTPPPSPTTAPLPTTKPDNYNYYSLSTHEQPATATLDSGDYTDRVKSEAETNN